MQMADVSLLSPLTAAVRPSRLVLRVSIACALLSACYGWVLSGAKVSNVFRAVRSAPWKKSLDNKVCRLHPSCVCVLRVYEGGGAVFRDQQ